MLDLLLLPISFFGGLVAYRVWEQHHQKVDISALRYHSRNVNTRSLACQEIISITSTNNSYDPMGDVLSELDMDGGQVILGEALYANMGGYMQ